MQFEEYVTALNQALASTARLGSEDVQRAAELLVAGLEPAARLTLTQFASDIAEEITAELEDDVVEIHLRAGQPVVVVNRAETQPIPAEPASRPAAEEGNTARLTLRLPESLKAQIEKAAAAEGRSTNTWLIQAAQQALDSGATPPMPQRKPGRRLSGWAQ